MSRDYPDRPVVGIGVLVWRGDEVLLVRRGRPPQQGEWSLPGGGQELGETLFEGAVREVFEETRLAVVPTGIVTAVDIIHRDEDGRIRYHYTLIDIAAAWQGGEAVPGDDAAAVRWARLDEVDELVRSELTRRVIRQSAGLRAGGAA